MWLADLGGRRLKLARAGERGLGEAQSRSWQDQPSDEELGWWDAGPGADGAPVWISSTRPRALDGLLAARGAQLRVVRPEDVPLARDTEGTGSDRLLGALAAWRRSAKPCVVLDLGTAWTLDLVDGGGLFVGGAIGPGLRALADGLATACPHLDPPASLDDDPYPRTTAAAVRAGTRTALLAAVQSMALGWGRQLGDACFFLTGGDAEALQAEFPETWIFAPHLVLEGLAITARERR